MKTLLLAALFAQLPHSQPKGQAPTTVPSEDRRYAFFVDARPVDGNLDRIRILRDKTGTYKAIHRVITAGFGFPVSDTTTVLGTGLSCVETRSESILQTLVCSADLRPADGFLIELSLLRRENGRYDAILHRAAYATLQSPELDETIELAYGLERLD